MKPVKETEILYVRNIINPLEALIQTIQTSDESSKKGLKELDKLLLEKYMVLENLLNENKKTNF